MRTTCCPTAFGSSRSTSARRSSAKSITTVLKALAEGSVLVLVILVLFLCSVRGALVVIVALPLSALLTFIIMRYTGLNANLMSLGGLAISIGMILDATIIQVENVQRHLAMHPEADRRLTTVLRAAVEVQKPSIFGAAHHRGDLHPHRHHAGDGRQDVLAARLHGGAGALVVAAPLDVRDSVVVPGDAQAGSQGEPGAGRWPSGSICRCSRSRFGSVGSWSRSGGVTRGGHARRAAPRHRVRPRDGRGRVRHGRPADSGRLPRARDEDGWGSGTTAEALPRAGDGGVADRTDGRRHRGARRRQDGVRGRAQAPRAVDQRPLPGGTDRARCATRWRTSPGWCSASASRFSAESTNWSPGPRPR